MKTVILFIALLTLASCNMSPSSKRTTATAKQISNTTRQETVPNSTLLHFYNCMTREIIDSLSIYDANELIYKEMTPFTMALKYKCEEALGFMAENNSPDIRVLLENETIISSAIRNELSEDLTLKFLKLPEVEKIININNKFKNSPLFDAVKRKQYKVADSIMNFEKIDISAQFDDGNTALHQLIIDTGIAKKCLTKEYDCSEQKDQPDTELIDQLIALGQKMAFYKGLNLELENAAKKTVMQLADELDLQEMLKI